MISSHTSRVGARVARQWASSCIHICSVCVCAERKKLWLPEKRLSTARKGKANRAVWAPPRNTPHFARSHEPTELAPKPQPGRNSPPPSPVAPTLPSCRTFSTRTLLLLVAPSLPAKKKKTQTHSSVVQIKSVVITTLAPDSKNTKIGAATVRDAESLNEVQFKDTHNPRRRIETSRKKKKKVVKEMQLFWVWPAELHCFC